MITSCLYCSVGDKLMTMLLIGVWLENWESTEAGSDSISEGPCRLKYMTICILMRVNEYHLRWWRVQSEPLGVERKGMTDLDEMNLVSVNNTILFPCPGPLEAHHIPWQLRT